MSTRVNHLPAQTDCVLDGCHGLPSGGHTMSAVADRVSAVRNEMSGEGDDLPAVANEVSGAIDTMPCVRDQMSARGNKLPAGEYHLSALAHGLQCDRGHDLSGHGDNMSADSNRVPER